ncbi:hypothetical protein PBI_PEREGRIN_53 [Rhodococcus phage Peregrin]|jgi:hypothetical protein|nr:hypothetical protein PBI_PEREGRIN_53 [Rhodococcus phage Peregrin]
MILLRDDLTTDLGRALYDYSPIRKDHISPETVLEIARAYCVREELPEPLMSDVGSIEGIPTVALEVPEERIEFYLFTKFNTAFKEHGYRPPLLFIKE